MRFFHKTNHGFTLIEILISISITGILTAIIFAGLQGEQQRSAAKEAADRLQVELIGLQNKIQSAVALSTKFCTRGGGYALQGKTCTLNVECETNPGNSNNVVGRCIEGPPAAYGLTITQGAATYTIFADMPFGTTIPNGQYVTGATSYDKLITSGKRLGTNMTATYIRVNNQPVTSADISFRGAEGKMYITKVGGPGGCSPASVPCSRARIVVRNTVTGVCYMVDLDATTGVITKRQYSPTCT